MADAASDFESLLERARAGSPEAVQELYDRYSDPVLRVVRRRLHRSLRRQYDSTDFLQSVWSSFFLGPPERYRFASPEEFVTFLSRVACNKVFETTRHRLGTIKRGARREQSIDDPGKEDWPLAERLPGPTPTPSQVVMAEESFERLAAGLRPVPRRALELLRQGHTHEEVATQLNVHPKSVQRLVQKLRSKGVLP
jgi:RNA polymerase sigma factor (sigma-70 family)